MTCFKMSLACLLSMPPSVYVRDNKRQHYADMHSQLLNRFMCCCAKIFVSTILYVGIIIEDDNVIDIRFFFNLWEKSKAKTCNSHTHKQCVSS